MRFLDFELLACKKLHPILGILFRLWEEPAHMTPLNMDQIIHFLNLSSNLAQSLYQFKVNRTKNVYVLPWYKKMWSLMRLVLYTTLSVAWPKHGCNFMSSLFLLCPDKRTTLCLIIIFQPLVQSFNFNKVKSSEFWADFNVDT